MRKGLLFVLLAVSVIFVTENCTHEPVLDLKVQIDSLQCDSNKVYFENQVLPILLSSCAFSGCHDNSSHKNDIILTDYEHLLKSKIIKVNNAEESKLYIVIGKTDKDRMPPASYPALSTNQTELIKKWINQGAINNKCTACDTFIFTFSGAVSKIIKDNCFSCHSGSNPFKNVPLENYDDVKVIVNDNRLLAVLNGTGYSLMPPSGKLHNCKLTVINKWINNGANNY